jgi:hypothetical protein
MEESKQSLTQRILEQNRQRRQDAAQLNELFTLTIPDFKPPEERQFLIWLRRYSKDVIAASIDRTAEWYMNEESKAEKDRDAKPTRKTLMDIIRYATKVMINKTAVAEVAARHKGRE